MLRSTSTMVNKFIVSILLLAYSHGLAQNNSKPVPLVDIIAITESKFDVKFSYAVEDVKDILIEKPDSSLTLEQTIAYLNAKTLLNFKFIDQRYITVSVIDKHINICGYVLDLEKNT
ncbi:MAG TPA: hypothetical protein VGA80_14555, partial [Flavobacteriaceae bacterium]